MDKLREEITDLKKGGLILMMIDFLLVIRKLFIITYKGIFLLNNRRKGFLNPQGFFEFADYSSYLK